MRKNQRQFFKVIVEMMILIKIIISVNILSIVKADASSQPVECPAITRCGSLSIPFPFSTSLNCSFDEHFFVYCDTTTGKAFIPKDDEFNIVSSITPAGIPIHDKYNILSISVEEHELRMSSPITKVCFPKHVNQHGKNYSRYGFIREGGGLTIGSDYFSIGNTKNKIFSVGCNIVGQFVSGTSPQFVYSYGAPSRQFIIDTCATACPRRIENVKNGTCDIFAGCCQKPIILSTTFKAYDFEDFERIANFSDYVPNNPKWAQQNGSTSTKCGYAFVAEADAYKFSSLDLQQGIQRPIPIVLEWAVANYNSCQEAQTSASSNSSYACKAKNSECFDSTNGPGYICKCRKGFRGNPYIFDGCQDVNECENEFANPCVSSAKCINQPGSFICICPKGSRGNGKKNETGCSNQRLQLIIALSVCIGMLVLLVLGFWISWGLNKRKHSKLKLKFFQLNGGILLQQLLSGKEALEVIKIYTEDELKKATNNYDEGRVLGEGANGRVYKGLLQDKKVAAIKKSKVCDRSQIQQFINELIVLFQIDHRNVVKLLGCCLETEVPILVYEFITNGTLSSHLHVSSSKLSWQMRLKIAKEVAGGLAYLHCGASIPIIHRDVKSSNILLDDDSTARISDFGASRLIPIGQTQIITLVEGTYGYFDPEYFCSGKLTEKSDVYSFGVVLAELLTGKEAVFLESSGSRRSLAMCLVSAVKEDCLVKILDEQVGVDEETFVLLKQVARLAVMCLRELGEERPTMKEVQAELEGILDMQ